MRSVMTHQFSQAPTVDAPRSKFDRSCGYKTTFNAGYLIPFFCDEVLPGDTFDVDATIFARLATPITPVMDNIFVDTFFFFVPNRLLWDHFVNFMGEQDNPNDSTDYLCPIIKAPAGGFEVGTFFDYIGIPTGVSNIWINAFIPRGYNKVFNDWFRDENLQNSVPMNKGDGPDNPNDYTLLRRGKRYDYFTSCLPWPQKGPAVDLPLGTTAPVTIMPSTKSGGYDALVIGNGKSAWSFGAGSNNTSGQANTNALYISSIADVGFHPGTNIPITPASFAMIGDNLNKSFRYMDGLTGVADLSTATAATINSLRQAFQLQKYYEKDARGGTRYIEKILSHFGVRSPDGRLQRSEYLGGSSRRLNITQVPQTSASSSESPLGSLAGYGVYASSGNGFVKSFTEHGVIIGLVNVRCDLTYQQGIDRMFSRRTITDFYWPSFAHLGEQSVLNKEIYATGTSTDDEVFGYQERYAEYRYKPSKITGQFRSNYKESLDVWHLSQYFENLPRLNSEFIEDNPPLDRVLAVQSENTEYPQILFDSYIRNICIRPMPVYSVPGLVDHF